MKASVTDCHCFVDCAPCYQYTADPERHCVCTECGHAAACHQSKGWKDGEGDDGQSHGLDAL